MRKQLNAYRFAHRASYERLALEIGPDRITARTLRRFVAADPTVKHHEMTLYAIQQFLKRVRTQEARSA